jgi:hypothetical protein
MELSSVYKIFTSTILIGSVIACKEDNDKSNVSPDIQEEAQKEVIAPPESQNELPECPELTASSQRMSVNSVQEFNNGSDGDFYLATDETFILEERIYNFNNIYLENNSNVEISEQANKDTAVIKINALGSCDFYGNLNFEGYEGAVEIRCDGQMAFGAALTSGYTITLVGTGAIVIGKSEDDSGEESDAGGSATISNGDDLIDFEPPPIVTVDFVNVDHDFPDIIVKEPISNSEQILHAETTIFYPCLSES